MGEWGEGVLFREAAFSGALPLQIACYLYLGTVVFGKLLGYNNGKEGRLAPLVRRELD